MKVNILLSTYNGEQYIRQQIESIQKQSFKDWNLLIRDDGSSDSTLDVIEELVKEDSRIRLVNEQSITNQGVIGSFLSLLKYEKADYYFFCDQDDFWLEDKLSIQLEEMLKFPKEQPVLVYTDLSVVNQDLNVIASSMIRSQSGHANTGLNEELTENTVTGGVTLINHALAELWSGEEEFPILMHDWYLALLASAKGKLVYVDQVTQLYRQHTNNVLGARTLKKRVQNWVNPHLLFTKYWDLIKKSQLQARNLLATDLKDTDREMVESFVDIMSYPLSNRIRILMKYGLKKNKLFHTLVFRFLIITKFYYRES